MGFNFGAFAGGLAKSGVDTYTRLSEEERRDAEAKRQADIHKAFLRNEQENERLSALSNETFGRVGQTDTSALSPREQDNPSVPDLQTGLPQGFQAKPYTDEQAAAEFKTRAMGINPLKAAEYQTRLQGVRKGELELSSIERAAKQDKAFDAHMDETHKKLAGMRQDIQGTFDTDGMNGLVKKYGSDFKDVTGNSVALVGNALIVKDSKGKVIGEPITRPEDAVNALSNVLGKKAMESSLDAMVTKGLFRNSTEMMDYFTKRNTMEAQTSNAQSSRITANAAAQNAATSASIAPSTIALHNAQAGMATAHAGLFNQSLELAKSNKEAREAMQPFLDQITQIKDPSSAEGKKAIEDLSMKAIAAGAAKSADIKGLLDSIKKQPKEPISNKDIIDFVKEFGDAPSNEKDKKTGLPIPIRQLPPAKQKAYAEDFFQKGLGTGEQGELRSDVKPAPRTEATAPAKTAIPTKTQPAASSAAIPAGAPAPIKTVAYGKTGYKMPGMFGVYDTPEQAQAAWAQKNAPMAPAGRFD